MEAKFSNRVKEVISLSREEALRLGHDYIGTEHLVLMKDGFYKELFDKQGQMDVAAQESESENIS